MLVCALGRRGCTRTACVNVVVGDKRETRQLLNLAKRILVDDHYHDRNSVIERISAAEFDAKGESKSHLPQKLV